MKLNEKLIPFVVCGMGLSTPTAQSAGVGKIDLTPQSAPAFSMTYGIGGDSVTTTGRGSLTVVRRSQLSVDLYRGCNAAQETGNFPLPTGVNLPLTQINNPAKGSVRSCEFLLGAQGEITAVYIYGAKVVTQNYPLQSVVRGGGAPSSLLRGLEPARSLNQQGQSNDPRWQEWRGRIGGAGQVSISGGSGAATYDFK